MCAIRRGPRRAAMTSPSRSDAAPKQALTNVPSAAHATSARTSTTRVSPTRPPASRRSRTAREHDLERVAQRLSQHRPERRGEVADEQVADHDARPQARPPQHERGDAHADRRPQRGHRPVQVGQAQADLGGRVVRRGQDQDRQRIAHRSTGERCAPCGDALYDRATEDRECGDHGWDPEGGRLIFPQSADARKTSARLGFRGRYAKTRTSARASVATSSKRTRSSTAWLSSIPRVPTMTVGIPRAT